MKIKLTVLTFIILLTTGLATADITFNHEGNIIFDTSTEFNSDVDLNNANLLGFPTQTCSTGEAVTDVNDDGTVLCSEIESGGTEALNLSEVLEEGNIANQSIEFSNGIEIGQSTTESPHNNDIAIGNSAGAVGDGSNPSIAIGDGVESFDAARVAIGENTDHDSSTGTGGTAVGLDSVAGTNASALGLNAIASGQDSVSIGSISEASGESSIALGESAFADSRRDIVIGGRAESLESDADGGGIIAIGQDAFADSPSSAGNPAIAIGQEAYAQGSDALAIGKEALASEDSVTAIGGRSEAFGEESTVIGNDAGYDSSTTINGITTVGYQAGRENMGDDTVFVGRRSGLEQTGDDVTSVGNSAGRFNAGERLTSLGHGAGQSNEGNRVTALGFRSGRDNTGDHSTNVGYESGRGGAGEFSTNIGYRAGKEHQFSDTVSIGAYSNTTNYSAVAIGRSAESGRKAVAIGHNAETVNGNSVAIGFEAAQGNTEDSISTIGYRAGKNNNGGNLAALGYNAGWYNEGDLATAVGSRALEANVGDSAVGLGIHAGRNNEFDNTISIGGFSNANATGAAAIGYDAVSNQDYTARFGSDGRAYDVDVTGDLVVDGRINERDVRDIGYSSGHTAWSSGLSTEEVHRFGATSTESVEIERLDVQLKGGGSNSNFEVEVYDTGSSTVLGSTTAGTPINDVGSADSDVTVRVTNNDGSDVTASITVSGQVVE